jgi:hypothetical protein
VWEAGTVVVRDICRPKGPKNPEVLRRERSPSKAIVMRSLEEVLLIDEAPRPTNQPTNEVLNSGPTTRNRVCERDVPQSSPIILRHVSHFPPLIGAIELHRIRSYLPRSRVCVCVSLALPPSSSSSHSSQQRQQQSPHTSSSVAILHPRKCFFFPAK